MTSSKRNFPLDFLVLDDNLTSQSSSHSSPRSSRLPPSYSFLVLDHLTAPATFLITHFITHALKESRPVIFLSATNSQAHWNGLLQKQGIQLANELKKGQFTFFNLPTPIGTLPSVRQGYDPLCTDGDIKLEGTLRDFFESVRKVAQASSVAPLLLIDDITAFHWCGHTYQAVSNLCDHIRTLQFQLSLTVVTVLHYDLVGFLNSAPSAEPQTSSAAPADEYDTRLFHNLSAHAHVIMKIRNLGLQGAGELAIFRGPTLLSDFQLPVTLSHDTVCQYRIEDNTVTYHTKGLDKGFL